MKCENCPYRFEVWGSVDPVSLCIIQIEEGENFTPRDENGEALPPNIKEDENGFPIEWDPEEECRIPEKLNTACLRKEFVLPLKALIRRILKEVKKHEAD